MLPTLTLSLLAVLMSQSNAHGLMCGPRQRGAYHSSKCGSNLPDPENPVVDYCAHCLNGGTVAKTKQNLPPEGWKNYNPLADFPGTADRAGLCGDPKGDNSHMIGGSFIPYPNVPIMERFKSGGVIDFTVEIDTNHNGYFEFHLCDLDACGTTDIAKKCFTEGHCYKLERVKHKDCENPNVNTNFECGPVDAAYPSRWYVPCRQTEHVGVHIVGGSSGTMRYKLPDGVECKHCVIQWYWGTANSCAPQGFLEYFINYNNPFGTTCASDGGGRGAHRPGMAACTGDLVPEEFWSCSDIQISSDDNNPGPVNTVGDLEAIGTDTSSDLGHAQEGAAASPEANIEIIAEETDTGSEEEPAASPEADSEIIAEETDTGSEEELHETSDAEEETETETGECLVEHELCDGSVPCCDRKQVCVYTKKSSAFSCRFWWSLWSEV